MPPYLAPISPYPPSLCVHQEHEQNEAEKAAATEEKHQAETMKDMIARSTDHFKRPKKVPRAYLAPI
jgi:hypothetical protein